VDRILIEIRLQFFIKCLSETPTEPCPKRAIAFEKTPEI
jgi:hypothetical protein